MTEPAIYDSTDGVAVIGMSGRFPKARNVAEFWQNLKDGVECISVFSDEELLAAGIDPAVFDSPDYVKAGGILEDIEMFDASFFGFNPREAEILDPQQRLFLECAWESLEDAGYNPDTYQGLIGVYAGVGMSSYLDNIYSNPHIVELIGNYQILLGNDKDHMPTYASYKLNLKGPSVAVQTACSTSLVAVCMACQSLLDYQCDMALAGGSSIALPQEEGYFYQEGMITSPDGHCRAFDAQAQGTVGGNGLGVVLLKRLADALADGDYIHAVIKGAAINNDGSLKAGYTAPSVDGQAQVIALAQAMAGVEAETISYIEAHGTGTPLGDPIEVAALTQAFRTQTQKRNFCAIGSAKTNLGHLDTAAGVAGFIKTVLALKHKMIPPSLHFEQPNPKIDFANSPFYVNDKLTEWKAGQTPRRAGVSSFGIGGTNAHVVLEEAPAASSSEVARPQQLLIISARTNAALDVATSNLAEYLKSNPDLNLADVAYTLQVGRKAFDYRRMVVCHDLNDAVSALETLDPRRVQTAIQETKERPTVFMFTGQGSQHINIALDLYQNEPTFREQVDLCSEILKPHLGLDVRRILYPDAEKAEEATRQLNQTALTQPALFVVEYALAKLWMEWGVSPYAMIGHSIGEYVAACLSGVFSLEDALSLVAARGRLMQQVPAGTMLAVPLPEKDVQPLLGEHLSLAAVNGPSLCIVSGPTVAVEQLKGRLDEKGLDCSRLHTSHAFHSKMMDSLLAPFAGQVGKVELNPPQIPYISNVTGNWITAEEATDPNYWSRHLRQTVRFADGLQQLLKEPDRILLEVGPGQTLSTIARRQLDKDGGHVVLSSLGRPNDRHSDMALLLTAVGRLWLSGAEIDWSGYYSHDPRQRIPLPTYPFERQRYWIEAQKDVGTVDSQHALEKQPDIADWFYVTSWKRSAPPELLPQEDSSQKLPWLIFSDECSLGVHLARRLEQAEQDVTTVIVGEQFSKYSEQAYAINPSRQEDYAALFRELHSLNRLPQKIVHLWSVTANNQTRAGNEFCDKCQDVGFYSLLYLAQTLEEHASAGDLQITVISNDMQSVTGEEILCPEKTTVLGPCAVIPQEYPGITCRSIDVTIPSSGIRTEEKLLDQLTAELTAETSDTVVAYRGRHRWTQAFESVRLEEVIEETAGLRQGGTYLITGGLGDIGLVLADHLARTVQAKLVLVGRSSFPEREEWGQWLAAHEDQDVVSSKIRRVRAIEELGAEVLVLSADVASYDQMQNVLMRTDERFGDLHGVIHAAGLVTEDAFQPVRQIDRATCARHFQPKVHGLLVLDKVLSDRKLDFCLLTSSVSAVLGGLGFVAYAAANIFMDAFASWRSQTGSNRWISVNWDSWQLSEEDIESGSTVAELAMTPEEGADAFQRILAFSSVPQMVVSTGDLQTRIDQWIKLDFNQDDNSSEPGNLPATHARPALLSQYVAPGNEVEQTIAAIWQKLLGIEQVGTFDNFFELGGHSLLAVQLISRLRDCFQIEVTVHDLFNAPTVAELAERIDGAKAATQEDTDTIDQMLHLVEQLSE
ncbi:MAG: SDR family NAD(P)-dependent oxidoreductase, partial [Acidobacteria bacterium]|nr:SDR family NAD(P)-dependent oxidoreductase [Acidobacteriota bacterium]